MNVAVLNISPLKTCYDLRQLFHLHFQCQYLLVKDLHPLVLD